MTHHATLCARSLRLGGGVNLNEFPGRGVIRPSLDLAPAFAPGPLSLGHEQ